MRTPIPLTAATFPATCAVPKNTFFPSKQCLRVRVKRVRSSIEGDPTTTSISTTLSLREEITDQDWNLVTEEIRKDDASSSDVETPVAYVLRFFTSVRRDSGLSDPSSGIWVCLIGTNGRSFLHRVSPIFDPQETEQKMTEFSQMVDEAPSPADFNSSDVQPSDGLSIIERFQQGDVDEVSFAGPDLGPIRGLLIGPESGSWRVDEVAMLASNTSKTEKFVCRDQLGGKRGDGAALLLPIAPDSVLYGSGQAAMTLTKDEAAAVRKGNLDDYSSFKSRVLLTTAGLVVGGGVVASATKGVNVAYPFATGGAIGILYQWLLQKGVDLVKPQPEAAQQYGKVGSTPPEATGSSQPTYADRIVGSQYFRFGAITLAAAASYLVYRAFILDDPLAETIGTIRRSSRLQFIVASGLGFFMYKVALIGVSVIGDDGENPE